MCNNTFICVVASINAVSNSRSITGQFCTSCEVRIKSLAALSLSVTWRSLDSYFGPLSKDDLKIFKSATDSTYAYMYKTVKV